MTLEEYAKIRDAMKDKITEARIAYQAAKEPLEAQLAVAYDEAVESAPFKVGDVVLAKHDRGYGWKPTEKCQITKIEVIGTWDAFYLYHGVKAKKDGTFGTQDALLLDVQPYTEQEAK